MLFYLKTLKPYKECISHSEEDMFNIKIVSNNLNIPNHVKSKILR